MGSMSENSDLDTEIGNRFMDEQTVQQIFVGNAQNLAQNADNFASAGAERAQKAEEQAMDTATKAEEQAQKEQQNATPKSFFASAWDGLSGSMGISKDQNGDIDWSKTGYNIGAGKTADGTQKKSSSDELPVRSENSQAQQFYAIEFQAPDAGNELQKLISMGRL